MKQEIEKLNSYTRVYHEYKELAEKIKAGEVELLKMGFIYKEYQKEEKEEKEYVSFFSFSSSEPEPIQIDFEAEFSQNMYLMLVDSVLKDLEKEINHLIKTIKTNKL